MRRAMTGLFVLAVYRIRRLQNSCKRSGPSRDQRFARRGKILFMLGLAHTELCAGFDKKPPIAGFAACAANRGANRAFAADIALVFAAQSALAIFSCIVPPTDSSFRHRLPWPEFMLKICFLY
jgi:hypothetical protein